MNNTSRTDFDNIRYGNRILSEELSYVSEATTFTKYLFNKVSTTERSKRSTSVSSAKLMDRLSENEVPTLTLVNQGFISETAWNRFGKAFEVSYEQNQVDYQGAIETEIKDGVGQIAKTTDYNAGGVFRQAFNTSRPIADGLPLVSASHTLRSGGTQANTFSDVQKPLSYASLLEGMDILNRLRTNSNEKVSRNKNKKLTLLIPDESNIKEIAFQLIGSQGPDLKPGTPNNDVNFFQKFEGTKFNLLITPALNLSAAQEIGEVTTSYTDAAAAQYLNMWFLIDEDLLMKYKYLEYVVLSNSESKTKIIETESLAMRVLLYSFFGHGVGAGVYTWIVGSKGDNSTTNF